MDTGMKSESALNVFSYMMAKCDPFADIGKIKKSLIGKTEEEINQRISEVKTIYNQMFEINKERTEKFKNGNYEIKKVLLNNINVKN